MPFARRMSPLPLARIRLTDPFWTRWQRLIVERSLPAQHGHLESTGRLANFRRAAGTETGEHEGIYFNDSDVYKWLEACAYGLASHPSPALRKLVDDVTGTVLAAQMPDGYLNTFFQLKHPTMRWRNLADMHEMYCAGHLFEAAVAMHECIGDDRLLDASVRFADHIMSVFGPSGRRGCPGHEEIELGLIRLAGATGEPKYREFARWLVEQRGQRPSVFEEQINDPEAAALAPWPRTKESVYSGEYWQDHAPIREHEKVVGHAVRAMYLYMAATDLADGRNDTALESAVERAWANLTQRRMYITGGIGPSASNEGFTTDFDLPNLSAYAETCAAIGLILWGRRMLEMTGQSDYPDVMERALYNGVLAGISLDGESYFYDNPLESRGQHQRKPWFHCACCPPNIARLIADLGEYIAGEADGAFFIHQYSGFDADTKMNGVPVQVRLESQFPWSGTLTIRIDPAKPVEFALHVRIPEWSDDVTFELTGSDDEAEYEDGYAVFRRTWKAGETLTVDLGVEPRWIEADPRVRDNLGRTALTRGPLVYCLESHELGSAAQLFMADTESEIEESLVRIIEVVPEVIGLTLQGVREIEDPTDALYLPAGTTEVEEADATFIPYFTWSNRGPSEMQVWVRSG